jgi:hypothetical protein
VGLKFGSITTLESVAESTRKKFGIKFGLKSKSILRICGTVWQLMNAEYIAAVFANGDVGHTIDDHPHHQLHKLWQVERPYIEKRNI